MKMKTLPYKEAFSIFLTLLLLSQAFQTNLLVYATKGNLVVTVLNFDGSKASTMSGITGVVLYDASYRYLSTKYIDSNSQVSWTDLASGTYFIEVYHRPGFGLNENEYWGGNQVSVPSGATNNYEFRRHSPIVWDIQYSSSSVEVGQTVTVTVVLKNLESGSMNCKTRLILDRDQSSPYDFDQTSRSVSIGGGATSSFSFTFTPSQSGTYYVYAVAYAFYVQDTPTDQWTWSKPLTVTYRHTVSVSGLTSGSTNVYLNGVVKATLSNGQSYIFTGLSGTNTISVDNPVGGGSGVRYYCSQPSITVSSSGSHTFSYVTQYYLTMQANPSNGGTVSPGSGWFNAGQQVTISASPAGGYSFKSWTGSGSGSYTGTSNPATITMNGPITQTANFQQVQQPFDFSISVSPSSKTVTAGQSTTYTVTVSLVSGAAQTVSLSLSGHHSSMSYSFNPASGSPSFTSTLTVSTTSSTPAQTYTLTITGTSGGVTRQQQVTLIVQPASQPDFSISANPSSLSFTLPSSGSTSQASTITVSSINGFSSQVSLSTSWVGTTPSGVSCSFSKNPVTPPANGQDSSTLTVTVTSSASTGTFTLRVTGTSGSLIRSTDIPVTISPTSSLSVQVSANPSSITTSQQSTITVTVTSGGSPVSGALVSLSSTGGSLNPASGTTGSDGKFTSTFSSSSTGTFTITATASKSGYISGSGSTQVTVTSTVQPPPTPSLISPSNGATLTSTSVTFSWSSSPGATDYQIEVNGPTSKIETVYSTSYTTTLSAGTYTWRVRAHNSAGYSSWTPAWSFTISTPPPEAYEINVQIDGLPAGVVTTIYVDGVSKGQFGGGRHRITIPSGSHTISVQDTISVSTDTRYRCTKNSQLVSLAGQVEFSYVTEFKLIVRSLVGGRVIDSRESWHVSGTQVTVSGPFKRVASPPVLLCGIAIFTTSMIVIEFVPQISTQILMIGPRVVDLVYVSESSVISAVQKANQLFDGDIIQKVKKILEESVRGAQVFSW